VLEGSPFEQFHHDELMLVLVAGIVDRADVRIVQRGGRARFALEPHLNAEI
jgi:hypothetical protein